MAHPSDDPVVYPQDPERRSAAERLAEHRTAIHQLAERASQIASARYIELLREGVMTPEGRAIPKPDAPPLPVDETERLFLELLRD